MELDISRRRGTRKVIRNEDMADQKKLRVSLGLQANDIHEEEKFQERFMAFIGDLNSRKQDSGIPCDAKLLSLQGGHFAILCQFKF